MYQIDFNKPIHIHFMGIGGISMSGLAHILIGRHFTVSGSDSHESELTDALEKEGCTCFYKQEASNIHPDYIQQLFQTPILSLHVQESLESLPSQELSF